MDMKKIVLFFFLLLFSGAYTIAQITISKTISQLTCNSSNGSVSITASGGTAPYGYEWKTYSGTVFNTGTSVGSLSAGLYFIKVTDANNISRTDSIFIGNGITAFFSSHSAALCPQSNGSAQVAVSGGVAPYSYAWSSGSTTNTASQLAGGSVVQVEVSDVNGCKAYFLHSPGILNPSPSTIGQITIATNTMLNATFTNLGGGCSMNNGTATVNPTGGTSPYSYIWNTTPAQNAKTATGLALGSHSVEVIDANGCTNRFYTYLYQGNDSLRINASVTNEVCGNEQGAISLSFNGGTAPYNVLWENNSSSLTRSNLESGYYTVTATDQGGCTASSQIFVDNSSLINVSIAVVDADCGNTGGSATAQVVGGTTPYTYTWSTGATTSAITNLFSNQYVVLVEDANGCTANVSAYVGIDSTNCSGILIPQNTSKEVTVALGKAYPNPAKDFASFSFEKEIVSIQVMDASGFNVKTNPVDNLKDFQLKIMELNKGVYFFNAFASDGQVYSGKMMVD
jgi:hypothetical protein